MYRYSNHLAPLYLAAALKFAITVALLCLPAKEGSSPLNMKIVTPIRQTGGHVVMQDCSPGEGEQSSNRNGGPQGSAVLYIGNDNTGKAECARLRNV